MLIKRLSLILLTILISNIGCNKKESPTLRVFNNHLTFSNHQKYITPNVFITKKHCKFYTRQGTMTDDNGIIYYIKNQDLNERCGSYPFINEKDIIWMKYKK